MSAHPISVPSEEPPAGNWLVGGGQMGELIRSMDWSQTPLGPMNAWPASLRTTVGLVLNSNFPISLAWGPQHTQIYNDGYWPICGPKHPHSMGQDFTECWATAFPVIGDAFRSALAGKTAFLEDQRMFLDRLGYLEETFFTFSFSPIRDETGKVAGLFHPATETTSKMVGQRRTRTLRDVAQHAAKATALDEGLALAAQTLGESGLDLPFVLFYKVDASSRTATLVAQGGLASPISVDLTQDTQGWPLAQCALSGKAIELDDIRERFPGLVCAPYPEPIKSAFVLPVIPPGHERPACIMVAGASARLPLNEAYRAFYDLLAATVTTVVANAIAHEAERKRAEALAEIDRAKTAFFSNVSHEFRTPLTLILGPLTDELAEGEAPLPPARRERVEVAHRNSLRLLKLVNTLLDFARIEAGRVQAVYEPVDLAGFTAELAGNFRSACQRAGLALNMDCLPLPEPVYVDREMWEKIVLNLLSNAFKFTLAGEMAVSIKPVGDAVELSVRDTGVGIPAEELPHLFERFYRVQGTEGRTHEGSGIGLALVHELVVLHGGSIRAASVPGQGSTFTVTIPQGTAHLPAERIGTPRTLASTALGAAPYVEEALRWLPSGSTALPPAISDEKLRPEHVPAVTADTSPLPCPTGTRSRILWADDNADMRDYVQRLLAGHYEVEAVTDGWQALAAARRQAPDLVLSDVMMPRLDGFGLLQELRADERTRALPVILLSARAGEEARIEGLKAGADNYLVKPFSARELLAVVGAQIEIARMRRETEELRRGIEKAEALEAANIALGESRRAALNLMEDAVAARRQAEQAAAELRREGAERKQAEEALRKSELFYRQTLESIPGMVFTTRPDGYCDYQSQQWVEFTGIPMSEHLGNGWNRLLHPEDQPRAFAAWQAAVEGKAPYDLEYRVRRHDGAYEWFKVIGRPIRDAAGHIVRWFGVAANINRLKEAEAALRQSEERLKVSLGEKEVMLKEIHHRVKNNLQVIASLVDLQTNAMAEPALQGRFQDVRDRVRSMALVHEKLYQSESLARVDFADYTRSLLHNLSRSHGNPKCPIELKMDLLAVSLSVEAAVPCGLILNELISNAFKHAFRERAKGEIRTALGTSPDGRVFLRVSDNGVGLPAGMDWRQARSLGLRLIHLLAQQLHATVEVRRNGGTEFEIIFESKKSEEKD